MKLTPNDWFDVFDLVGAACGYLFTRAIAGWHSIRGEWKKTREDFISLKNSDKAQWKQIDEMKQTIAKLEGKLLPLNQGKKDE